jgi:hypothetical protein
LDKVNYLLPNMSSDDDEGNDGLNRGWTRLNRRLHTHGKRVIASQDAIMEGLKKMLAMHKAVLATDQEGLDRKMNDDCVDILEELIKITWDGTNESYGMLNKSVGGLDRICKVMDDFWASTQGELQTTVQDLSVGLCKMTGALEGERGFGQSDDDSYSGPYGDAKFAPNDEDELEYLPNNDECEEKGAPTLAADSMDEGPGSGAPVPARPCPPASRHPPV